MLANMKKQQRGDSNSLLYSYYTLAHSTSQQRDSPSPPSVKPQRKNEIESGDETDKSVEPYNEIVESFFMDEITLNTESCSLSSSRENLLDGDIKQGVMGVIREGRSGSRPNSRPSSARRGSLKSSELPVVERIKVLEEGLKEADMEREVVLSCLGKEYLERLTMQNCLQEICLKSGYNYDEVKANMDVQNGAKNILDSMIEMRTKEMLKNKGKNGGVVEKTVEGGRMLGTEGNKEKIDVYVKESYSDKDKNVLDTMTEEKLKEVIAKVIQAEQTKHNIHTKRREESEEISHTQLTKGPSMACESTTGANNSAKNGTVGSNNIMGALETNKDNAQGIVSIDQSDGLLLSADDNVRDHEKNTASQNDEKTTEKLCVRSEQSEQPKTLELKYKQNSGLLDSSIMPSMTDKKPDRVDRSILQSLDKVQTSANKSLDSIDEGIFMLKTFLTELLAKNQRTPGRIVKQVNDQDSNAGSIERKVVFSGENGVGDGKPRRKLSLNDLHSNQQFDLKPQRRRSIAEGMDNAKPKISPSKRVESRLFSATVASQNKMKGKIGRRETESDTESAKKTVEMNGRHKKPKHKISRSATDVRDYSTRSAYTSTEEDDSIDGDDDFRRSLLGSAYDQQHSFKYVQEINQVLSDKEYTKLFSILNMLQDQKRKWEDESRLLKLKIDDLKHSKSDLTHDNSVLRKSLEAANHAIKEINGKVQELKLTIVPLRDENSKLREQNHSLKSKLDLLRKDKAVLLQEFQELKKTKLKYEEKLQLVTDLYQNGRINLDQNNNHPTEAADAFSKGGLKALLEPTVNESPNEQSRLRRNRNQDQSKRHSFHGFEKIEELAGNTEELLAEKEKVEDENMKLKKEVMELRQQIAEDNEENGVTDEELLNGRKGWKMQREESKHRIIREILKTESTQVYGRPYSSCSDLTLADSPEYSGRSVWGGGKKKNPHGKEKAKGAEENGTEDPRSDWNESIKLAKELKLNQRKENRKDSSEPDDGRSKGHVSFEIGFEKSRKRRVNSWKEESEKIEERLAMFKAGKEAKAKKVDHKKNNSKKVKSVDNAVSKEDEGKFEAENDDSVDNAFQSEDAQKRDASKPSTQWPIVKEKIQAIYGQPVDLEFAKSNADDVDGNVKIIKRDSGRKIDTNGNGESYYSKYEAKELAKRERNEVTRSKVSHTRRSVQEMVARHVMQDDEEEVSGNENDWSRMESDWQRKSSDAENDYETYKEITKQRQQARNRSKHSSRTKSDTTDSNTNKSNTTKSSTTKSSTTKSNTTKSVRSQNDTTDGRKITSIVAADSENGSPWVDVPVYLKKNEKDRSPKQNKQKKENKSRAKTKTVEETISKVESAFSIAKAAGKKLFKKHEKVAKSSSAKDIRENFKRTSGTVMYLDELSNSSSDEDQLPRTIPRRTRSFRRPRPKSDYWSNERGTENGSWQRGSSRSLRLPKQTRDDMFAVDISIEAETENRSANSSFQYDSFNQFNQSAEPMRCQHQQQHHHGNQEHARHRIHSETGTSNTRSAKRPKSPGGFSCEMCRELNKKKTAQEKYCWEKYFPIGETTVDYSIKGYREDYV